MKSNAKGFSLVELLIAVVIIGILAAIALPSFIQWRQDLQYREAARNIASILRDARQRAIATNREYRAQFLIGNRQYQLARGNAASGSGVWTTALDLVTLPQGVNMMRDINCDNINNVNIVFNPNGRSDTTAYICIMDTTNTRRYRVEVASPNTGRVTISR